ncbi:MAG: hypothetical protein ACJ8H8_35245 [Geminicoccaceae bacterium]|jgi:hypothetical protein
MGIRMNLLALPALAGCIALAGAPPAQAHHNDWAAPLVGGALGGYALGTIAADSSQPKEKIYEEPAPVYYAPAPTYVAPPPLPSTASIEAQLAQLDKLAAGGYITPQEYQNRRKAVLNEL